MVADLVCPRGISDIWISQVQGLHHIGASFSLPGPLPQVLPLPYLGLAPLGPGLR